MINQLFGTSDTGGGTGASLTPSPAPESDLATKDTSPALALPPEAVAVSPPIKALKSGQPPALWASTEEPNLGALFITENLDAFQPLGLGLYRGKDKVVLFNPEVLPSDQLKQLDAAGQLDQLAAPLETYLGESLPKEAGAAAAAPAPAAGPAMGAQMAPPAAGPAMPPPAPMPVPQAPPQAAQNRLNQLAPKSPSERPLPGQGVVINGLLRRAA